MFRHPKRQLLRALFTFVIAIIAIAGSHVLAQDQTPQAEILATQTGSCDRGEKDKTVPATIQGGKFGLVARGFFAQEPLLLSITFADGRTYSLTVTQDQSDKGLNGINRQLADAGFTTTTTAGGDYMGYFQTHNGWPVGCTAVTVFGITSQLRAQAQFKILAQGATNTNKGQTTLTTTILNGTQPNGVQGATVNIRGRDYRSEEYLNLYVVQPDGTIVYLTPPLTSKIGNFQMTVTLGMNRQVGTYTFVAVGQNGFGSTADFTLYPAPIFAQGFGQLRIADPQPVELAQGKAIQLQGRNFGADEAVVITLIQPDGVHADLMTTQSNQVGEIAITLGTNVQMPIGKQQILAASATTAVTSEISITYGEPVIPLEALLPKLPSGDPLPPSLGVLPYPSTVALPNAVQPIFLRPVAPTTSVAPVSVPVIVDVQPAPSQPTPTPYWPPF